MRGIEFYKLLEESDEFCAELGRAILAAGRLEGVLIRYFEEDKKLGHATLGILITHAKKYPEFENLVPHLEVLKSQRNYLTHNIFSLLSDRIEETILERHGLVDLDVITYKERAWNLKENLNGLANIVERML